MSLSGWSRRGEASFLLVPSTRVWVLLVVANLVFDLLKVLEVEAMVKAQSRRVELVVKEELLPMNEYE